MSYICIQKFVLLLSSLSYNHHFGGSDEYLLPKIAERDLRRFANLRSTSSNLGIHIPLQEVLHSDFFILCSFYCFLICLT